MRRSTIPRTRRRHVLVVRAVEDAELAGLAGAGCGCARGSRARAPPASAGRTRDVHAGGIELADDVADRAALARGVHPLQHEQHAARAAPAALRVELLLQRRDPLGQLGCAVLGVGLALLEAGGRPRVDPAQVDRAGRGAEEGGERAWPCGRTVLPANVNCGWVGVGVKWPRRLATSVRTLLG